MYAILFAHRCGIHTPLSHAMCKQRGIPSANRWHPNIGKNQPITERVIRQVS
jgi:hypothetical protein